jgi:hypothetical protein
MFLFLSTAGRWMQPDEFFKLRSAGKMGSEARVRALFGLSSGLSQDESFDVASCNAFRAVVRSKPGIQSQRHAKECQFLFGTETSQVLNHVMLGLCC